MSEGNGSGDVPFVVPSGCFSFVLADGKAVSVDYVEAEHEISDGYKEFPADEYQRVGRFRDWLKREAGVELTRGQANEVCHEAAKFYLQKKRREADDYASIQKSPSSTDSAQAA